MPAGPSPAQRSSTDTKARIILVAQEVFAAKGYSHAGLREIAAAARVAPSLLIKYFGTKGKLFEEALAAAIIPIRSFQQERARLGEAIVASVLDREAPMHGPAMIVLGLGDPESREIVEGVVKAEIIEPMANWLGADDADARALSLLAMTTGLAMFHRSMSPMLAPDAMRRSAGHFARMLQSVADLDV